MGLETANKKSKIDVGIGVNTAKCYWLILYSKLKEEKVNVFNHSQKASLPTSQMLPHILSISDIGCSLNLLYQCQT